MRAVLEKGSKRLVGIGIGHRLLTRLPNRRPTRMLVAAAALLVASCRLPVAAEEGIGDLSRRPPMAASPAADRVDDATDLARFLDRLMLVESGGRDDARNPRSTAVGPFQFIESTFLEVTRRHFPAETSALTPAAVLQMRTNRAFARLAAAAFTRDNAAHLATAGLAPTFANLRLAFLVGPGGAVRILKAEPRTPAIAVLGSQVVQANPFMAGMSVADLALWSARNLAVGDLAAARLAADPARLAAAPASKGKPAIAVRCNQALASCRRWVTLATRRLEKQQVAGNRSRATKR